MSETTAPPGAESDETNDAQAPEHAAIVERPPVEPWSDALAPATAPAGSSYADPVGAYLSSLGTDKSRSTAREAMRRIARVLGSTERDPESWRRVPWTRLTHAETNLIRAVVVQKYAPATARLTISVLKEVLHRAYRLALIDAEHYERAVDLDPVRGVSARAGREITDDDRVALAEHFERLPRSYGSMTRALFAVGMGAGLRREEIAHLTVAGCGHAGELHFVGKGRKEARQPIMPWADRELRAWLDVRGRLRDASGRPLSSPTVFLRSTRHRGLTDMTMTPRQVWDLVVREVAAAGIEKTVPHDLRRTFGTRIARRDVFQAKALLRHADISTTERYDRRGEDEAREALRSVGETMERGVRKESG